MKLGYATNNPAETDTIATPAISIEIVCHHGGPRYVLRVHPIAKLNATEQYQMLLDAISVIKKNGGVIISLISDNAPTNVKTFKLMGGPGKVTVELEGQVHMLFLVYDYVHLFKNIRNNWITEMTQQLNFTFNGKPYLACWSDVISLYEEDRKSPIRLTKLTNTSVYPKPLQRQSVPLVCQVFNDKTVAAFKVLKGTVDYSEGTVIFIELITNWFKMMNVKDKYACIWYRDELGPFSLEASSDCRPLVMSSKVVIGALV